MKRRDFGGLLLAVLANRELSRSRPSPPSGQRDPRPLAIPVIHCTDLFHPPDDPDDHVDLATLFALPELDIRAIILDQGLRQRSNPGSIPINQMFTLTGRRAPYATGLAHPLRYPEDKAVEQFPTFQGGVNLILRCLDESSDRVSIIVTGSLRDVAAAFNREPALFRSRVDRIYFNDGNSSGGDLQWNPLLDPQAYIRIMRSDLPVYWCPAFGAGATLDALASGRLTVRQYQVYWQFLQGEVFDVLTTALQNFFLYALAGPCPSTEDPIAYLKKVPPKGLKEKQWKRRRNMWSTASLLHVANRVPYKTNDSRSDFPSAGRDTISRPIYDFVPATVTVDSDLRASLRVVADQTAAFRVFRLRHEAAYARAMTAALLQLLRGMRLVHAICINDKALSLGLTRGCAPTEEGARLEPERT